MNKYKSDKSILTILSVISIIMLFCIIYLINNYLYYISARINISEHILKIAALILIIAYVTFAFVILPLWHRSLKYFISDKEIVIHSGVVIENSIHVKMSSIQYTTAVKCPFSNKINFNILLLSLCNKRLALMFLSLHDMEEINKIIQSQLNVGGE